MENTIDSSTSAPNHNEDTISTFLVKNNKTDQANVTKIISDNNKSNKLTFLQMLEDNNNINQNRHNGNTKNNHG